MQNKREKKIIQTSIIGILANVFLSIFKVIVGVISNSIAIILDAVNNLSDALSSIITIIGTKLSNKAPDKEHPYGHGRIEYLTAMLISIIILYAGTTSFIESIKKIISPEIPDYSTISLIIIVVAVIVKVFLGIYVKNVGKKFNSESLVNSGKDALMDSIISSATLVAAIIYLSAGFSIESYLAAIISLIIIRSGLDMLKSTLSQILGKRISAEISNDIKKTVLSISPDIKGAYDLILNDYGPDTYLGSIHIEIPSSMTASEIDKLTRNITKEVFSKHNILLSAVGIYSFNTDDNETNDIRNNIFSIVHEYKSVLQMHGFYFDKENKFINFDIIVDFAEKNKSKLYEEIIDKISSLYPDYQINITIDMDMSD